MSIKSMWEVHDITTCTSHMPIYELFNFKTVKKFSSGTETIYELFHKFI
jgi:hypothetical protein